MPLIFLRQFLHLAIQPALSDGFCVRNPLTGVINEGAFLVVFQQYEWLAVRDRWFPFVQRDRCSHGRRKCARTAHFAGLLW